MPTTKITDLTAYADPASTDVLPIVDIGTDTTKKVTIADLMENAGTGAEATPSIAFDGDPNTGIYRPGADQIAISTGGTQRLLIDATGAISVSGNINMTGTGAIDVAAGTTAERPGTPSNGMFRYNSTDNAFEGYANGFWGAIGGGATGGGSDQVFYENGQTVTTSYTLTASTNAMSAGPITIDAGATVTIGAGQTWTIV